MGMSIIGVLFFIFAFLIAGELFLHIVYFWQTGKGGLNDPPFAYLTDIFRRK